MSRRGRGEGSIYLRHDSTWAGALSLPGADGRRTRKFVYGQSKKEVIDRLQELKSQLHAGFVGVETSSESVGKYLDAWLQDCARPRVKPNTYECYENTIRVHLKPVLGSAQLGKLSPANIQYGLAELERRQRSARTRRLAYDVLKMSLDQAVRWGKLSRNPADAVDAPTYAKPKAVVLDVDQAAKFMEVCAKHEFWPIFVTALATTARIGECLALRWSDVSFPAATLSINKTLIEIHGKVVGPSSPKSKAGTRVIALPEFAVEALRVQRERLMRRWGLGAVGPNALVFPNRVGKPLLRGNVNRALKRILREAGLPVISFHKLRHTSATLLLSAGENIKVVQERLGHSKVALTLDTYSHVLPNMQASAAARMDQLFKPAPTTKAQAGEDE